MDSQVVVGMDLPRLSAWERRRYPRMLSRVEAVVWTHSGCGRYEVVNLSVCGALLSGGVSLSLDTIVETELRIPESRSIRVLARVARRGVHDDGRPYLGVEFIHRSDETEDRIQAVLLEDIERSQTHGVIADIAD